jgi:aspartate--ammonia ligase
MGVRVNAETLKKQLEMAGQLDSLKLPYHQAGQSRTYMYLLRKAHLGEVSVTVWPQVLKNMCAARHIHVLE